MRQIEFDFATQVTNEAIQAAEAHANAVHTNWSIEAFEFLKVFLVHRTGTFMVEDVREAAAGIVPTPPSLRAYGAIIRRAAIAGLVRKVGYGPVKNIKAHKTPVTVWVKI